MLGLVPRPAWIAPRVAIGDRGRSQKIFFPVGHSKNHHTLLFGFSRFTPKVNQPKRSGHDFPRIHCSGTNFAEIYSFPSKRGFGLIPPIAITPTPNKYISIKSHFPKPPESEHFSEFFLA
jgi:hypothetical protein